MSNRAFDQAVEQVVRAYDEGRWEAAGRLREILMRQAMEAVSRKDVRMLTELEKLGAKLFAIAVARHDADVTDQASAAAWLGSAFKELARPVLDVLSTPRVADQDRTSAESILAALIGEPARSNVELADRAGLRPETVCRLLPSLRAEGLVVTRKAGQRKITQLTSSGRSRAGGRHYRFDLASTFADGIHSSRSAADQAFFDESNEAVVPSGRASPYAELAGNQELDNATLGKDYSYFASPVEGVRADPLPVYAEGFQESRNSTVGFENDFNKNIILYYKTRQNQGNGEFLSGRIS